MILAQQYQNIDVTIFPGIPPLASDPNKMAIAVGAASLITDFICFTISGLLIR